MCVIPLILNTFYYTFHLLLPKYVKFCESKIKLYNKNSRSHEHVDCSQKASPNYKSSFTKDSFAACLSRFEQSNASFLLFMSIL